ncbi:hypothetical protein NOR_03505 [Metarhizium rileyi]|uniref:Uncharacterized protein n=1 Tax=Metarhizium rileyi (strain RCEF 4871) TaxID=1649241 RepID=A0A167F3Q6_METRR|nr:hypothetical protein NOR_03505 [Metarhizium rileyi RCEF 4871]
MGNVGFKRVHEEPVNPSITLIKPPTEYRRTDCLGADLGHFLWRFEFYVNQPPPSFGYN